MRKIYYEWTLLVGLLFVLFLTIGACSLKDPITHINTEAVEKGYSRILLKGNPFQHILFVKKSDNYRGQLHVYIEGDGTPWINRRWIARDPTSRNPLMLHLMAMDSHYAVYLGRPCYLGLEKTPPCRPSYWTSARYSEQVVNSMSTALKKYIEGFPNLQITLMGHSGGGSLAMLLAQRIPQTVAVVTLAANMDIDAWANHNGYSPLTESLNPANQSSLSPHIQQWHFAGKDDTNIPLNSIRSEVARQPNALLRIQEGQDHSCCWEKVWPSILGLLDE
ncbi:MAG: alpha/beta hydrolase [Methylococcales bacterium]